MPVIGPSNGVFEVIIQGIAHIEYNSPLGYLKPRTFLAKADIQVSSSGE